MQKTEPDITIRDLFKEQVAVLYEYLEGNTKEMDLSDLYFMKNCIDSGLIWLINKYTEEHKKGNDETN